jgi:hypothetical protein
MLPDYLEPDLRLVLVGTAVGEQSATRGHYYAGPGNSFWKFLHEAALTPTRLEPLDDATLPRYGIGLTDLVKSIAQSHDRDLPYDFPAFTHKIEHYPRPQLKVRAGWWAAGGWVDSAAGLGVADFQVGLLGWFADGQCQASDKATVRVGNAHAGAVTHLVSERDGSFWADRFAVSDLDCLRRVVDDRQRAHVSRRRVERARASDG